MLRGSCQRPSVCQTKRMGSRKRDGVKHDPPRNGTCDFSRSFTPTTTHASGLLDASVRLFSFGHGSGIFEVRLMGRTLTVLSPPYVSGAVPRGRGAPGAGGPRARKGGRGAREVDPRDDPRGGAAAGDAGSENTPSVTGNEGRRARTEGRGMGRKVSLGEARVADWDCKFRTLGPSICRRVQSDLPPHSRGRPRQKRDCQSDHGAD
jgi:hypothetical protein